MAQALLEKAKKSKLKYSPQAMMLLGNLKDEIDLEDLERWVEEKMFVVGGGYIIRYMEEIKKLPVLKNNPKQP